MKLTVSDGVLGIREDRTGREFSLESASHVAFSNSQQPTTNKLHKVRS